MELGKLKEPFPADEIEWRLQQCGEKNGRLWGKCLAYVTNRAICNRLDEVCGAENWKNEFTKAPDGGVLCGISIKVGSEWVTKYDGAENTDIEGVKGGLSGSMKRAASTGWGIGRYLYNLEEGWAEISDAGRFTGKTKDNRYFKWSPPALPDWALPGGSGKPPASTQAPNASPQRRPKFPETPQAKGLKSAVLDYINNGIINDKQTLEFADQFMFDNDTRQMTDLLNWCKQQETERGGA